MTTGLGIITPFGIGSVMVDGHTTAGAYPVTVHLTGDELHQLIRSMQWALMMDSHEDDPAYTQPKIEDIKDHRAFLREIIAKLEAADEP